MTSAYWQPVPHVRQAPHPPRRPRAAFWARQARTRRVRAGARRHQRGRVPPEYEKLAKLLLDYERPIPRLQEDMAAAKLRVADTLLPLGARLMNLSQSGYLRSEEVLSPLVRPAAAGGRPNAAPISKRSQGALMPAGQEVDPLLAKLPEARQRLLYGLLLSPEDLGEPGAIDLLMGLLSTTYVLPVHGSEVILPHSEFDQDSKTLLRWTKRKDEAKRFAASSRRAVSTPTATRGRSTRRRARRS